MGPVNSSNCNDLLRWYFSIVFMNSSCKLGSGHLWTWYVYLGDIIMNFVNRDCAKFLMNYKTMSLLYGATFQDNYLLGRVDV